MPRSITVQELKSIRDRGERHALLDVRERGEFHRRQIPGATPLPRGWLELRVPALVPLKEVPVAALCEDGQRSAAAALTLERMGYSRVMDVAGGIEAWAAAGYPTQKGIGVPGKDYGEKVAVVGRIPQITPEELVARQERGEKFLIMDSRTVEEYRRAHLPGAYSVPGGELPAAVVELLPDRETAIVVNCAGRTRSILGSEVVRRMGLPNPVYGFKNGTMAWEMAGFQLERGPGSSKPAASQRAQQAAEEFAQRVAREEGLRCLSVEEFCGLRESGELHYLIDVRLPEEYLEGHIPGAVSCPGGQLALNSEDVVAVRDATIVLACDRRARATLGASLYTRMGFPHVFVLDGGIVAWQESGNALETGQPQTEVFGLREAQDQVPPVEPLELKARLDRGEPVALVDVRGSGDYALGHLAGSRWVARGNLELQIAQEVPDRQVPVVALCDTGLRSTLAGITLRALGYSSVSALEGGLNGWRAAGLPLEEGLQGARATLEEAKGDIESFKRAGFLDRTRADMESYLSWEEELGKKYEGQH